MITTRTIVAATEPRRYADSFTEIFLKVWFEEIDGPVPFLATPFDCERHGKQLWIRAMAGHYGPIDVIDAASPLPIVGLGRGRETQIKEMLAAQDAALNRSVLEHRQ